MSDDWRVYIFLPFSNITRALNCCVLIFSGQFINNKISSLEKRKRNHIKIKFLECGFTYDKDNKGVQEQTQHGKKKFQLDLVDHICGTEWNAKVKIRLKNWSNTLNVNLIKPL